MTTKTTLHSRTSLWKPLFLLALLVLLYRWEESSWAGIALAKEIEATQEWQLVGENDTLPAGLHIRMDLSTGQKWAKLPDDSDERGNDATNTDAVTIDADGSVTALSALPNDNDIRTNNNDDIPDYDYDMMHRTLSQLPPEEQARVGGIPELPQGHASLASLTERERELVETRLRHIWEQRQEELRRIEEDHVADLPEILKGRIQSLRDYLQDPVGHYQASKTLKNDNHKETEEEEESLDTIVDVLADLEFLLTDLDMTRDFYTLGGWPLLSSLVSNDVHRASVAVVGDSGSDLEQLAFVQKVQSNAAWALGTAVKNTGEFAPWTVEPLIVGDHNDTTALDLLQASFASSFATTTTTATSRALQQKLVYALGSFLRGNLFAQIHFAYHDGPNMLARTLEQLVSGDESTACTPVSHCTKLTQRLLSLATDVVLESQQHQKQLGETEDNDKAVADALDFVLRSFTEDTAWCDLVLAVWNAPHIDDAPLASAAVHALPVFEPQCSWDAARLATALGPVREQYQEHKTKLRDDFAAEEELAVLDQLLDKMKKD